MDEQRTNAEINSLVTRARDLATKIEGMIRAGKSGEIQPLQAQRIKLLNEASKLKADLQAKKLDAWQNELDEHPAIERGSYNPNDPTTTREYAEAFKAYADRFRNPQGFGEAERHVLSITSDPGGGYTVPADMRAGILARIPMNSQVLAKCDTQPTSRDTVEFVRVQARGTQGSIYTSAFVGSMVGETPAAGDGQNEPAFGKFQIPIKKARTKALISMDLAADAETDLANFLRNDGALNMALLRESQVLTGTGIGKEVKGIVQYNGGTGGGTANGDENSITVIDISGTTATTISNTLAALGSATKLLNLISKVPAQYRRQSGFGIAMNSNTQKAIRLLTDAQGRFLWAAGFADQPDTLDGYPCLISEFLDDDGASGKIPIIAGDFGQCMVRERMGVQAQILMERYADNDEIALFLRQRFGVGISNCDAFRFGIIP